MYILIYYHIVKFLSFSSARIKYAWGVSDFNVNFRFEWRSWHLAQY